MVAIRFDPANGTTEWHCCFLSFNPHPPTIVTSTAAYLLLLTSPPFNFFKAGLALPEVVPTAGRSVLPTTFIQHVYNKSSRSVIFTVAMMKSVTSSTQRARLQRQQRQQSVVSSPEALVATSSTGLARFFLVLGASLCATGGPSAALGLDRPHWHRHHRESLGFVLAPKAVSSLSTSTFRRAFSADSTPPTPCRGGVATGRPDVRMSIDPLQTATKTPNDAGNALSPSVSSAALTAPTRHLSSTSSSSSLPAATTAAVAVDRHVKKVGDDRGALGKLDGDKGAGEGVRRAVASLPGTWWAAGLPKWVHLIRRRMITKEDFFHLHAASGMVRRIAIILKNC